MGRVGLAAGVLAGLLAGADAQAAAPRVYLGAAIGAADAANGRLDGLDANVTFDLARPVANLVLGLETERNWLFELEGGYRYSDAEVVYFGDGSPDFTADSDSRIEALSLGVNAIYRFDPGLGFRPYLGVGLANAWLDYQLTEFIFANELVDDSDTALAYQLLGGFGLDLTAQLELLLDLRLWRADDIHLTRANGTPLATSYEVRSAMLGLRYRPGATRPRVAVNPPRSEGWYIEALGGASFAKDAEIKNNLANFDQFDVGGVVAVALGRRFGRRWRIELEAASRRHQAEIIDFNPEFGENRVDGRVRARSLLANVVYQPGWQRGFQPYIGIGAGLAWTDWDVRLQADSSSFVDDRASAPALQVRFGASADLTERLQATAELRYWLTGLLDMEQPDGRELRTELAVSSVLLGLRWNLH